MQLGLARRGRRHGRHELTVLTVVGDGQREAIEQRRGGADRCDLADFGLGLGLRGAGRRARCRPAGERPGDLGERKHRLRLRWRLGSRSPYAEGAEPRQCSGRDAHDGAPRLAQVGSAHGPRGRLRARACGLGRGHVRQRRRRRGRSAAGRCGRSRGGRARNGRGDAHDRAPGLHLEVLGRERRHRSGRRAGCVERIGRGRIVLAFGLDRARLFVPKLGGRRGALLRGRLQRVIQRLHDVHGRGMLQTRDCHGGVAQAEHAREGLPGLPACSAALQEAVHQQLVRQRERCLEVLARSELHLQRGAGHAQGAQHARGSERQQLCAEALLLARALGERTIGRRDRGHRVLEHGELHRARIGHHFREIKVDHRSPARAHVGTHLVHAWLGALGAPGIDHQDVCAAQRDGIPGGDLEIAHAGLLLAQDLSESLCPRFVLTDQEDVETCEDVCGVRHALMGVSLSSHAARSRLCFALDPSRARRARALFSAVARCRSVAFMAPKLGSSSAVLRAHNLETTKLEVRDNL